MGMLNTVYTTVTCEICNKTATYLANEEQAEMQKEENAWIIKTARVIQNLVPAPGQQKPTPHLYCSDVCEIKATETGAHNVPEPKRIVDTAATPQQVAAAAAAAKMAAKATEAMKTGNPVTLG